MAFHGLRLPGCGSGGQLTVGSGPAPGEWDVGAGLQCRPDGEVDVDR